jgi:transcription elongation factor GreB
MPGYFSSTWGGEKETTSSMSKAFMKDDGEGIEELPLDAMDEEALRAPGKRYITRRGFEALQQEMDHLWRVERPKVTQEVSVAADHGDRSENAEYQYGKQRLREIDRRLRYLSRLLDRLTVVDAAPEQQGRVFFGAWVTVEDEEGEQAEYQIVGPDEFDPKERKISVESPLARALLGKREDDEVSFRRPKGPTTLTVVSIRYELPA